MRIDLPNLVGATIVTGSLAITGSVTPGSDALYDFGTRLRRWNNIYAANISGSLTGSNVTAGQIVVAGTGGVLSGTNNLFWNNSNGRLGIGMTNPSFKLDLSDGQVGVGVGAWSAPAAAKGTFVDGDKFVLFSDVNNKRVIGTNNTGYGVYFQNNTIDNDGFTFIEGNSALTHFTRIKLGKVGIGSTNPTDQVTISSGNVQVPRNSYLGSSATGAAITIGTSGGSQIAFPQVGSNDEVAFITHVNGSFHGERVRIAASGNVGLGTTNPGFRLQLGNNTAASTASPETINLGGTFSSTAGANAKLRLFHNVTDTFGLGVSAGQLDYIITDSTSAHVWYTNGAERLRLTSAGKVGIGTTQFTDTLAVNGSVSVTGSLQPGISNSYTLGATNKLWSNVYATAFSGSLTKLATGADYLVAGSGITLTTGSSGNITITATVAGSSLVGGSNTQVQFNDGGTFGANSGLTYNKTTGALTGTYVVASTGFSGSLTKLANGSDYLLGGGGITVSTGSNGAVTISLNSTTYATASFTNATSVTVNHSVGTTLYDIEVFDTGYSKIIPMTATATSNTQSLVTFAIPTSGYVAVGGPMAGPAATILTTTTGSAPYYGIRAWAAVNNANTTPTFVGHNISSVSRVGTGQWDVTFTNAGYADVNSIGVLTTFDSNYNISMGYVNYNSSTSKIRIECRINNGTMYSVGFFTVACLW